MFKNYGVHSPTHMRHILLKTTYLNAWSMQWCQWSTNWWVGIILIFSKTNFTTVSKCPFVVGTCLGLISEFLK